ncbi:MAG: type 3 dihydrofolate reductase [Gammaproteobacteria bacterium]|nr:type 3 dihydrofolate reductase [Gammaproteobacteria bacterium]
MLISIITAMDQNQLIGKKNGLPWKIPADLQFFKKVTMSKPIIMGRKTFESIGRPLPGRRNIIITRDQGFSAEGCEVVFSLEMAIEAVQGVDEAMVIGGANIYQQFLDRADRLYMTRVLGEFEGDAWFPEVDFSQWHLVEKEDHKADEKNECDYSFQVFNRNAA